MNETEQATLNSSDLAHFIGTEGYHALSIFREVVFTDGCKYVAEKGGAFWLMDQISAILLTRYRTTDFVSIEFSVTDKHGILSFRHHPDINSDEVATYKESIEFTDFPLASIKFYAQKGGPRTWVLMLTSEY